MKKLTKKQRRVGVVAIIALLIFNQVITVALYADSALTLTYQQSHGIAWLMMLILALLGFGIYHAVEWIERAGED